jgi:hypothetical protein
LPVLKQSLPLMVTTKTTPRDSYYPLKSRKLLFQSGTFPKRVSLRKAGSIPFSHVLPTLLNVTQELGLCTDRLQAFRSSLRVSRLGHFWCARRARLGRLTSRSACEVAGKTFSCASCPAGGAGWLQSFPACPAFLAATGSRSRGSDGQGAAPEQTALEPPCPHRFFELGAESGSPAWPQGWRGCEPRDSVTMRSAEELPLAHKWTE